jgi:hypothetical protein
MLIQNVRVLTSCTARVDFPFLCFHQAVRWQSRRSPAQRCDARDAMIQQVKHCHGHMTQTGLTGDWFLNVDAQARKISGHVNGPLFHDLLRVTGHHRPDCVDVFRYGAKILDLLDYEGLGEPVVCNVSAPSTAPGPNSCDELKATCYEHNLKLLSHLKENEHSQELLRIARADAALGRMSDPVPLDSVDLHQVAPAIRCHKGRG